MAFLIILTLLPPVKQPIGIAMFAITGSVCSSHWSGCRVVDRELQLALHLLLNLIPGLLLSAVLVNSRLYCNCILHGDWWGILHGDRVGIASGSFGRRQPQDWFGRR